MRTTEVKVTNSGFVSIIGRPNVGKSTLMNRLSGGKISITANKPQTTRNKIRGILTDEKYQIIFIDTPGIHKPRTKLGDYMAKSIESSLNEIDLILYLVEPSLKISAEELSEHLRAARCPVFLIINKIDKVRRDEQLVLIDRYKGMYDFSEIIPISALDGENTVLLLETIKKYMPPGPEYFPSDMITDQPERQIASEIIREKALLLMQEEIPHGVAVEITSMKKRPGKELVDVEAIIYCEKDSHKGMIIGKQGAMLKKIGTLARADIENLLGSPIYLQLWVKVKKDWRDNDFLLKNFGYNSKNL